MSLNLQHFMNEFIGLDNWSLFFISIFINVVISILGFLPSVFLTAFNISVFGLWPGIGISTLGESLGAIVSFYLYRKGIKFARIDQILSNNYFLKLKEASGTEWIILLILFRMVPFVPSSVVTVAAAFSSISIVVFSVISSVGKIPSLLIEAFVVVNVLGADKGKAILLGGSVVVGMFYLGCRWRKNSRS
ncbi:TVP38/TMEM64 family protein [Rossellomorea sp. GCM10028870]|uniref:TVP38/TMEM64 family protein n=1 Tax=Rossellomorea sp. GCM10028870 TaxID=3273426 RepID=UPI003622C8E7